MSLLTNGTNTLNSSISNIEKTGLWILVNEIEYFISFSDFPWFKDATVDQIFDFQQISPEQLRWKSLDIDIEIGSLKNPHFFPLKYKE